MKLKKRIISLFLALSTIVSFGLSSPMNIHAGTALGENGDGLKDNTASGGDTTYNPSGKPVDSAWAEKTTSTLMIFPESMGYRISIVDSSGNRVTNSIDLVEYAPYTIFDGTHPLSASVMKYPDWYGDTQYAGKNKKDNFFYSNGIKTEDFTSRTWRTDGVPNATVNGKTITTQIYPIGDFQNQINLEHAARIVIDGITETNGVPITIPLPVRMEGNHGIAGGADLMKIFRSPLGKVGEENTNGDTNIITMLVNMKVYKYDNMGKKVGSSLEPLFTYVDPSIQSYIGKDISKLGELSNTGKGNPSVGTNGTNTSTQNNTSQTIKTSDIIIMKGYKVVVEPLFWDVMSLWAFDGTIKAYSTNKNAQGQGIGDLPAVCYGTQSYLSKYAYEEGIKQLGLTPEHMSQVCYGQNWREAFMGVETLQLAFEDKDLGMVTIQDAGLTPHRHIDGYDWYNLKSLAEGDNYRKIGYGVHIYDKLLQNSDAGTPTWDKDTYPPNNYKPGPSPENTNPDGTPKLPDYPSEGDEYKLTNKDHQFHIIKFYAEKQPDNTYKYIENHTRDNTIHTININDEPNYIVDSWFTSPEYRKPTSNTDSYDVFKSTLPKGEKEGTKAESIVVKPESNDTTLYIRLVSSPSLTIIKYFPDGSTKTEEIPWIPSYNSDEEGYVYEEDKQSPDKPEDIPSSYEATNGTPENNPIIPVKTDTRIVYIKYKDVEADSKITLHQNELAHTFTLEDIQSLVTLTHNFANMYYSGSGKHGSGTDTWYCDWETEMNDSQYKYIISNKENYGATTFVGSQGAFTPQEIGTVNDSGSMGISGGPTGGLTPNLKFSIYRDKAKDNVTLYPNKNNSVKGELAEIYITKEGYTPQTNRVLDKGQTEWHSTFKINYTYDVEDNKVSYKSTLSCHGKSGTEEGSPHSLSVINDPFSQANNVLTKAYLGQPGIGDKESTLEKAAFNILGKTFNKNLVYEKLGEKYIQFFPYIKMKYNTVEDETNKEAYIVSTNESKVRNLSSVETGVYQSKNGFGINISSEQWSTHRKTTEGLKENGVAQAFLNKGLLPGGAVIKLNTSNTNNDTPEVWVGLRTYEMSIPDDLKVTLSSTDDIKTTSEAKANAEQLVEDVRKNLSNYHVEKWIKEGITTDENDLNSGASKVSGVTYKINNTVYKPVTRFGDNDLSTDSKYYLKEDVNGADSSKLDVINIDEETNKLKDTEIHIYNISSDTEGKVTVKKDGVEIASSNIKKDKNASSLLSNEEVRRVNDRVKFVENFIASLDFEEGKDRENRAWYYEAQDGIDVVEMTAAFHLGFGKDNAIRSEVADVKLTGKLDNKGDILNFDSSKLNEKTRTVQYRLSAAPANASCEKAGYIGTFNGQEIRVDKMYTVMRSRLYYMGNNTVMDLN